MKPEPLKDNRLIAKELAKACRGLSKYCIKKEQKDNANEFEKRAKIFDIFANRNKQEVILKMPKKITPKEKDDKLVERLVNKIVNTLERKYGISFARRACFRYYSRRGEELRLKREIAEKEGELQDMKKKINK